MGEMKDRMLRGDLYVADDELAADYSRAREIVERYNRSGFAEPGPARRSPARAPRRVRRGRAHPPGPLSGVRHPGQTRATLTLPRGVPHAHLVTSAQARLLTVAVPGGFERLFTELGSPVLPGAAAPPIPDRETRLGVLRRLGVEVVGPPPAFDIE